MPINQDPYRHTHLIPEQIVGYLTRQCNDSESHAFEKHLLNCSMCQDALEGYETMNAREIKMDLDFIQSRLDSRIGADKFNFRPFAIAAGISVLLVSVFFAYQVLFPGLSKIDLAMNEDMSNTDSLLYAGESLGDSMKRSEAEMFESLKNGEETQKPVNGHTLEMDLEQLLEEDSYEAIDDTPIDHFKTMTGTAIPLKKVVIDTNMTVEDIEEDENHNEENILEEEVATVDYRSEMKASGAVMRSSVEKEENFAQAPIKETSASLAVQKSTGTNTTSAAKKSADSSTTSSLRVDPKPLVGLVEYNMALQKKLIYPEEAIENSISGSVVLGFKISVEGKVKNVRVIRGLGFGCDAEAIRLINVSGDWIPGKIDNVVQEMDVTFTIVFKLPE